MEATRLNDIVDFDSSPFSVAGSPHVGTHCEVWKLEDESSHVPVALKILRKEWSQDDLIVAAMKREWEICSRMTATEIVRAYDKDLDCERPWMLMEWIEGESLEECLKNESQLSIAKAVWIVRQIAQSLQILENYNTNHGDLKPSNVMLQPTGFVKLVDLGFSNKIKDAHKTTRRPLIKGTIEYLAPELVSGEFCHPVISDIYSLGIIFYRMIAGRLPFRSHQAAEVVRMHRQVRPPGLDRFCPQLPLQIHDLIDRMLAKHPLRRIGDLDQLVRELIDIELQLKLRPISEKAA